MSAFEIHIQGLVQGVGFRPFVARLASELKLNGWVKNQFSTVVVRVNGSEPDIKSFISQIQSRRPNGARIHSIEYSQVNCESYERFSILESDQHQGDGEIPMDVAPCKVCQREMLDSNNRRYMYPFTNCSECGPRFSIIETLPFDRSNTAMQAFNLCPTCESEYDSINDRRFHAQTSCCPDCGPKLVFQNLHLSIPDSQKALNAAVQCIREGGILLLKGVGGYQYLCRPDHLQSVEKIKHLKNRTRKAFAILVPNLEWCEGRLDLSDAGKACLESPMAPIVLAKKLKVEPWLESISQDSPDLGVMLPSSSLHFLLIHMLKQPLICTSANVAGQPMIIEDEEASSLLSSVNGLLCHDRKIHHRLDDTIYRDMNDHVLCIRPGRGMVPFHIVANNASSRSSDRSVALGAELKSTFSIKTRMGYVLSPYQGDLHSLGNLQGFEDSLKTYLSLLKQTAEHAIHDRHPNFQTSKLACEYPASSTIQHHQAHILACALEHGLSGQHYVIGLALDGFGYGETGESWGAELFSGYLNDLNHCGYVKGFRSVGTGFSHAPWKSYLAYLISSGALLNDSDINYVASEIESRGEVTSSSVKNMIKALVSEHRHNPQLPLDRSFSRLLEAIAFHLACVNAYEEYESQGPIAFERLATESHHQESFHYEVLENNSLELDFSPAWKDVLAYDEKQDRAFLARKWMNTLVQGLTSLLLSQQKRSSGSKKLDGVILSGGCFQNRLLLTELKASLLTKGVHVFHHGNIPCNDSGISLGQMYAMELQLEKYKENRQCV